MSQKETEKEFQEVDLQELAKQLSRPEGQEGIELGQKMNETNIGMTRATIEALGISDGENVLEIGHGNCSHLPTILTQAEDVQYHGLEISEAMYEEAQQINSQAVLNGSASFHLYDGSQFPLERSPQFHKVMTVNTIYFWDSPPNMLDQVSQVLHANGRFSIGFAQKEFMKQLPFVEFGFKLYDLDDIKALIEDTPFQLAEVQNKTEEVESKDGTQVKRTFTIATLTQS